MGANGTLNVLVQGFVFVCRFGVENTLTFRMAIRTTISQSDYIGQNKTLSLE